MGRQSSHCISQNLSELAKVMADWIGPHRSFVLFLFGSRVRGDHRPDSDVDVVVDFHSPSDADTCWWLRQNEEDFAEINTRLPGPLQILERNDPLWKKVIAAGTNPVHRDRNVLCVWMPPKPNFGS